MTSPSTLGPLERTVMDIVWQKQTASVRDVWLEVKKTHSVAYTTIMTILTRLFDKGFVRREKRGKSFVYFPKNDKQQTVKSLIRQTIDSLVDTFGDEAVVAFIDQVSDLKTKQNSHVSTAKTKQD